MHQIISSGKRTVTGEMKPIESELLDSTIASFFYDNALAFNVADSPSLAALVDQFINNGAGMVFLLGVEVMERKWC